MTFSIWYNLIKLIIITNVTYAVVICEALNRRIIEMTPACTQWMTWQSVVKFEDITGQSTSVAYAFFRSLYLDRFFSVDLIKFVNGL